MHLNKPVIAVTIIILSAILIFFFVMPQYRELKTAQIVLAQDENQYESKLAYYLKISQTVKQIESHGDVLEKINDALPSQFSFASLIYFFQKTVSDSGLTLKTITFSPFLQDPNSDIKSVNVNVSVSGSYANIKKFLAALDTSARLFEVNSIGVAMVSGGTGSGNGDSYNFQLEVKTNTY